MQIVNIDFTNGYQALAEKDLNTILAIEITTGVGANVPYSIFEASVASDASTILTGFGASPTALEVANNIFEQKRQATKFIGVDAATITVDLNNIATEEFFYVVSNTLVLTEAEEIKDWCVANDRLFFWTPDMLPDAITGIPAVDATQADAIATNWNNEKAVIACHIGTKAIPTLVPPVLAENYNFAAGWVGRCAPLPPGGTNWAHKIINGAPVNYFSATEQPIVEAGDLNWMQNSMGLNIAMDGVATDGTYIDIVVSKYWLRNKLEASLVRMFIANNKIPFTNDGKALIKNAIDSVIDQADRQGILVASETTVEIPDALVLDVNDRARRKWTGIKISTRLQGAVNQVDVEFILNI